MCLKAESVLNAVTIATKMKKPELVADFNVNNVSEKVVKIILSYTDYVNRTTWSK